MGRGFTPSAAAESVMECRGTGPAIELRKLSGARSTGCHGIVWSLCHTRGWCSGILMEVLYCLINGRPCYPTAAQDEMVPRVEQQPPYKPRTRNAQHIRAATRAAPVYGVECVVENAAPTRQCDAIPISPSAEPKGCGMGRKVM